MWRKTILAIAALTLAGGLFVTTEADARHGMGGHGMGMGRVHMGGSARFIGGGPHFVSRSHFIGGRPFIHNRRFVFHRFHHRRAFVFASSVGLYDSCWRRRLVLTPWGWVWRRVWICRPYLY